MHATRRPLALDLFCGAGGASIGLYAAGYDVIGFDKWGDAVATHNHNGIPAYEGDLSTYGPERWAGYRDKVDLLWGSPPCQPFSQAGKHAGRFDERDGFPWFLAAVQGVRPRLFVMENVKGLTFRKNLPYLAEIVAALSELGYRVEWKVLSCADYGVPQKRQRLFMVGRRDGEAPVWPVPTHARNGEGGLAPWVTMAEALGWTEPPADRRNDQSKSGESDPMWPMYEPASTVAGRNLVPDPGANANRFNGRKKSRNDGYFVSAAEAATLQAFPPYWEFLGTKTSQFLQIGNAVPPVMAHLLATVNK